MIRTLFLLLLLPCLALADDPVPPPTPAPIPAKAITISVPRGVLGEGKRLSPYVFDSTTKCYLSVTGEAKNLKWDLEDGPPDAEPIGDAAQWVAFSQASPGLYVVTARWEDNGYTKLWLEIKGSGPSPQALPLQFRQSRPALGQLLSRTYLPDFGS